MHLLAASCIYHCTARRCSQCPDIESHILHILHVFVAEPSQSQSLPLSFGRGRPAMGRLAPAPPSSVPDTQVQA
eukprot:1158209-Pelagomonas_calceolata.AAC.11